MGLGEGLPGVRFGVYGLRVWGFEVLGGLGDRFGGVGFGG